MSQPRRIMPLPLGGEHGLPYSRGLMARALMAVGVSPDRAYALARRVGDDLASRSSDVVAEHALVRGARVVLAENEVVAPGLDEAILALVPQRVRV